MATRTRTATPFDALVRALRPRTPDVSVRKRTADLLYDADVGNRTLVGVLAGADEAVYYSTRTRCVAAVSITDVGPDLGSARPLGQAVDDPDRAFDHVDAEWAWTNPSLDGRRQPPSDGRRQPPSDGRRQPPSDGRRQPPSDGRR